MKSQFDIMNYDASKVGVLYARTGRLIINYPIGEMPSVRIERMLAVKLADGSVRKLEDMPPLDATLDMTHRDVPIPLVNPEDNSYLGVDTSLGKVFIGVLAVVRSIETGEEANKAPS